MTDPTITSTTASTTLRPPAYGTKSVGKAKPMRRLTSKTRKQRAPR